MIEFMTRHYLDCRSIDNLLINDQRLMLNALAHPYVPSDLQDGSGVAHTFSLMLSDRSTRILVNGLHIFNF